MSQRTVHLGSALVLLLLASAPLGAQSHTTWLLGAGISSPAGEFNTYAGMGWDVTAGLERQLGNHPTSLRLDVGYAINKDTTGIGFHETTRIVTAMANVVYHFTGARPRLYMLFGLGAFARRFSSDDPDDGGIQDTQLAFQVGEGASVRIKSATVFLEGRFVETLGGQRLEFFPLVLGVRIGGTR